MDSLQKSLESIKESYPERTAEADSRPRGELELQDGKLVFVRAKQENVQGDLQRFKKPGRVASFVFQMLFRVSFRLYDLASSAYEYGFIATAKGVLGIRPPSVEGYLRDHVVSLVAAAKSQGFSYQRAIVEVLKKTFPWLVRETAVREALLSMSDAPATGSTSRPSDNPLFTTVHEATQIELPNEFLSQGDNIYTLENTNRLFEFIAQKRGLDSIEASPASSAEVRFFIEKFNQFAEEKVKKQKMEMASRFHCMVRSVSEEVRSVSEEVRSVSEDKKKYIFDSRFHPSNVRQSIAASLNSIETRKACREAILELYTSPVELLRINNTYWST